MIDQKKIDRINELAKRSKDTGLTEEEKKEQAQLRAEYVAAFKASLTGQLNNTVILRPDGTREKLKHTPRDKKNS